MSSATTAPASFKPAACPLLAAVLPLRYAIGPLDPQASARLDSAALGLPPLAGQFPELGPDHPQLHDQALGYVPRMLRDGWLYLWDAPLKRLTEYQVEDALLKGTPRGDAWLQHEPLAYLMLEAGVPVRLVWSPVRWSDAQFAAAKERAEVRQRVMRELTPGAGHASGSLQALHPQIADKAPQDFTWSSAREPRYWLLEEPPLKRMHECEQQHYAVLDDPWGVLFDLAGLLRARNQAFDKLSQHHGEDWAVASLVKAVGDSDAALRKQLPAITDFTRLQAALQEQERETTLVEDDRRRLAQHWVDWLSTLGDTGPASLETACGHFDITEPAARDALEASFAAACLGPAATSLGVKALEQALSPDVAAKPWLLWAVLGVREFLDPGRVKQLLHVPESLEPVAEDLGNAAGNLARALALTGALNTSAAKLEGMGVAAASEPLPAALAPLLGGHLRNLTEQPNPAAHGVLTALLARSGQRLDVQPLTQRQSLEWLSAQMGQAPKGQRREMQQRIAQLDRAGSAAAASVPHLRLLPALSATADAANLPPLGHQGAALELPKNFDELFKGASLKTTIALMATWNLWVAGSAWAEESTAKSRISLGSAAFATITAVSAIFQQLYELDWKRHVAQAGKINPVAQALLAKALGVGAFTMLLQSITAGVDVLSFGWQALDAYRAGDLDTAAVNAGLAGAQLAYMRVSVQAMQAMRLARAAVLAGEAEALGTGLRVLSLPLRLNLAGLTVTILLGLVSLFYTRDTPVEQWLKQTRFGIRPAAWAGSLAETLQAFYRLVMPVRMSLERINEMNPYTGALSSLYLFIRLPGQRQYRQGMLSFDGQEVWQQSSGLFGSAGGKCVPLVWGEDEPIPFQSDSGSRVAPEPDGSVRLRRVIHEDDLRSLERITGSLVYQPLDGLYLPPIDIDLD